MPCQFDLVVTIDAPQHAAEFRLLDAHGAHLAYRRTDFKLIRASHHRGLFDLGNYLRLFCEPGQEAAALAEIGVCLAHDVLGMDIFSVLWRSQTQRTLCVRLPAIDAAGQFLAAAMARLPWEIARPAAAAQSLGERNLIVRLLLDIAQEALPELILAQDESLRVLFVFAEARGSRPLAVREERHALLQLFRREIYPQRRVEAHFLTHGVTRERLVDQIQRNGGYHVVHWSGHGHLNLLELSKPGGARDHLSGQELLNLFHDAGGVLPRLMFLSACHSGDVLRVRDWDDFLAVAQGNERDGRPAQANDLDVAVQSGVTGTAHALLVGGIPSVVAMRYAVGDAYARHLGLAFYRALLAHEYPRNVAAALALARNSLRRLDGNDRGNARYAPCDHATPVLYGAEQPDLPLRAGRSRAAFVRDPHRHRIAELTLSSHAHFVGRTWELDGLGSDFIGSGAVSKPIAVIAGLGGMGKTALIAEVLDLWAERFDHILLYRAKPEALGFDATLQNMHGLLMDELGHYYRHVKEHPADAIYREASADFTGPVRLARLLRALVRALRDEAILLVLDNFETNLKPQPDLAAAQAAWACQDPAWDACLRELATELVGSRSRVLISSRRPLAALAGGAGLGIPLGPLPANEAALYLRTHPALCRMAVGADETERQMAREILDASRFHPLLMDRLARLAAHPAMRGQLLQALETLGKARDFAALPALFTAIPGDATELAYLDGALKLSLDQLIEGAGPDARLLLWMISIANDPVTLGMLMRVWAEESLEREQLRKLQDQLGMRELQISDGSTALSADIQAMLDALSPAPVRPSIDIPLRYLVNVGLATEERNGPDDLNPEFSCHELVRERIRAWMAQQPADKTGLSENTIRLAYASRLAAYMNTTAHLHLKSALAAGQQAMMYCVQAEDWKKLADFISLLVAGSDEQRLLEACIPPLQVAAAAAPEGLPRWRCLSCLADALSNSGRPKASLPFYAQAATAARSVIEAGQDDVEQAWADLGTITGNWANACGSIGNFDEARSLHAESLRASRNGRAAVAEIIGREIEVLRIDVIQGKVEQVMPQIEGVVVQMREWWQRYLNGEAVPEAPNKGFLASALVSALDVANDADQKKGDFVSAMGRIDEILQLKRALEHPIYDILCTRYNRANLLRRSGRLKEAKEELEACLDFFYDSPYVAQHVLISLAEVFNDQDDRTHAVNLARRALVMAEQVEYNECRADIHCKLADWLSDSGMPDGKVESSRHLLAGIVYQQVAGLKPDASTAFQTCLIIFSRARSLGEVLTIPSLAELLADPSFAVLGAWLSAHEVDITALQAAVELAFEHMASLDSQDGAAAQSKAVPATANQPDADTSPLERSVVPQDIVVPVWFGTNRKPVGNSFGSERHGQTTLGRALVHVPDAHRFGETGNSFWYRLWRFDLRDDHLRLQTVEPREADAFFAEVSAVMQAARDHQQPSHALLYLHGFNVSFEEAAIRAAQLSVDLKVPCTAFFSWPSRGSVAAYPVDEASIEASEPAITRFLVDFAANCGAEKIHLIAHSMGNRGLLRALQRIAADAETRGNFKLGQIFLAAPDVDRDLFVSLASLYPRHAERVTLYASSADKALHLSARLHDAPRAGYYSPYTVVADIDTVAVPNFDVDALGHAYYAQAEALLHDISTLMQYGTDPCRRQRLRQVEHDGSVFWELRR